MQQTAPPSESKLPAKLVLRNMVILGEDVVRAELREVLDRLASQGSTLNPSDSISELWGIVTEHLYDRVAIVSFESDHRALGIYRDHRPSHSLSSSMTASSGNVARIVAVRSREAASKASADHLTVW